MSRSAPQTFITVMKMPTAPTQKDHSTARAVRDTLVKESVALVKYTFL